MDVLELKQVDLESRQARHQRLERLFRDGLTAESDLTEAVLDIRRTEIELRQLRESMDNLSETTSAEIDRLRLETNILLKQTKEQPPSGMCLCRKSMIRSDTCGKS